jgi:hypothetical protein
LRCQEERLRQEMLRVLLALLEEKGAAGHTTWFLNENDFALTEKHEAFLHEALRRGDSLGIHDHIDFLAGRWEYDLIHECCRYSRDTVAAWLAAQGSSYVLTHHRAGCLFQNATQYAVLRDLGYTVLSDVYPGDRSVNQTGYPSYDNRNIPPGILPYRHDPENFLDYESRTGCFLQVPVAHMYIYNRDFVGETILRWEEAFRQRGVAGGPIVWCFHPYELLDRWSSRVSRELVRLLALQLDELVRDYGVEFVSLDELVATAG